MYDLAIVGAGPAGMAAAVAVADAGFRVMVVDEQARAGGQIFRRPPEAWGIRHGNYRPYRWAAGLIDAFEAHPGIETAFRSTAFGVLRDRDPDGQMQLQLAVQGPQGSRSIAAKRLLIATGAYDMPVAFPGWTLAGVMTAGAVQSLLKSQKLLLGKRLVLAGSHPIQLILAAQLLEAGADIAEIAFARGLPQLSEMLAAMPAVPGHVSLFAEAARALAKITLKGVKISRNTIILGAIAAPGDGGLQEVELSKVDRDWQPCGPRRRIKADVLALGYGFNPSTELARQAGCALRWNSAAGGWVVGHDDAFQTDAAQIYVAGEPTGVAGAERARAEGQMAGLSIAEALGAALPAAQRKRAARLLARAGRFSAVMQQMFAPQRQALAALSRQEDVIICRCELVRNGQLETALERNPFMLSASAVKLETRCGMGPCQGRYCEGTLAARIAAMRGAAIADSGHFNIHLPVKPVPLQAYCGLASEMPRDG